jgi:hypothetical protein
MNFTENVQIVCESGDIINVPRSAAQLSPILKGLEGDEQFPLLYGDDVIHWVKSFLEHYLIEPLELTNHLPVKYSTPMNTIVSTWYVEFLKDVPVSKVKMLFDIAVLLDVEPLVDLIAIHIGRLYALLPQEDVKAYLGVEFNFEEEDLKIARDTLQHHMQYVKV